MGVLLRIHARTADYHVFQLENIKQPADLRYRHQIDDVVDEIVARRVFDCLRNAAVFGVGGGAEQSELERPCLALIEAGADRRHEVDPYVSLAFGEVDQVPLGHQFDHDIWMDRIEIGKLLREVKGSDAFHCGEPDAVGGFARDGPYGFDHRKTERLHLLRDRQQPMAILRQQESVGFAVEQLDRKVLLELRNSLTYRGMVDL